MENQNISSKILGFIRDFEMDKNELIRSQSGFAVSDELKQDHLY